MSRIYRRRLARRLEKFKVGFNKARQKLTADQQKTTILEVRASSKQKECALLTKRVRQCERKIKAVTDVPDARG
eukprot:TRINITY_DN2843_c0_g1_i1.p1 TRINITY_DN2843_c0_g1~~TRINITY_DN2843_c0_g1_i1.p1  ORF type:complete len:74 (-),score=12.83 TRINITY_DN2843_c0_g1_i1:13-234(-)